MAGRTHHGIGRGHHLSPEDEHGDCVDALEADRLGCVGPSQQDELPLDEPRLAVQYRHLAETRGVVLSTVRRSQATHASRAPQQTESPAPY